MRAALIACILAVLPSLLEAFVVPKAMALRLLGLPLLAGTLVWAMLRERVARPTALDGVWLAWVVVAVVAAVAARSRSLAWYGEPEQREGLLTLLALAGIHAAARASHRTPRDLSRTLSVVLLVSGLAAAWGLVQALGLDPLVRSDSFAYGAVRVRPGSTLGNPILLGVVLAPALALGVTRLARQPAARRWMGPLLAVMGCAAVATLSRGAWLASATGIAVAAWLSARLHGRRATLEALAWVAVPAALWAVGMLGPAVGARLAEGAAEGSGAERLAFARAAWGMIAARPWTGVGPDGFALAYPGVQSGAAWAGVPAHAHSALLQLTATQGVFGLLVSLVGAVVVARSVIRHASAWREGLPAALAALAVGACVNPLGHAGAAMLAVATGLSAGTRDRTGASRSPAAIWPLVAGLAVLGSLVPDALREWGAERRAAPIHATIEASLAAPDPRALAAASDAADVMRGLRPRDDAYARLAADAHLARARVLAASGEEGAIPSALRAERAARSGALAQPLRAVAWERLGASLAAQAGLTRDTLARARLAEAARSQFIEAARLAPKDAPLLTSAARHLWTAGSLEDAREFVGRTLRLEPVPGEAHAFAAALALAASDTLTARRELHAARVAQWEDERDPRRALTERWLERLEGP